MGITPGLIAGVGSAIGGLSGLLGGSKQPQAPQGYQPQYSGWVDSAVQPGIAQLGQYNTGAQAIPYAQQAFQSTFNNPYAGNYQQNANATADIGQGVGGAQIGGGLNLIGAGSSMLPWAQQILQTGFDPQNALYNRTQQQLTDQIRAGESARGIAMSPYGAGVENKGLSDFNIDWQNQQLNRQNTAAQGAGYLTNSAGNAINLGQNVSTLGLQTLNNAAALPYSTANTIGQNQFGAINQFGQAGATATDTSQKQIQDYLAYLGVGNQAAGVANQGYANQLTAQNQQFNQGQTLGKNLGAGAQGIGNWFSGGGSPGSMNVGGAYYPAFR
jgi:hypothetical protein